MQPIMAHLREKGWVEKAYSFWKDEALQQNFPFVIDGMRAHLEAAPDLKRLLTLWLTDAAMDGYSDITVALLGIDTFNYSLQRWSSGNILDEEGWWYVAGAPGAPQPNNFIDHPNVSQRSRAWMSEKCGVVGDLYWFTTYYWGSNSAPRNPWLFPMTKSHLGSSHGNADGVLLYPPVKSPPAAPIIAGPINSFRWEMLREAQEDREYFWLLRQLVAQVEPITLPYGKVMRRGKRR